MGTAIHTHLEEATIQDLRKSFRGTLLRPIDDDYESARRIWNGMIDRKPALIARCTGAADVIAAVTFARTNNLLVSVRGGGHNVTGNAVCDNGLLIDLSTMKGIRVDPAKRTARAEAGLTWGEFDHETQAFGLATNGGFVSTTGIAGLTLGGGMGFLMRHFGLTCDNVLSVDIVTAAGEFLTASSTENADLFRGVRGGGGNFGIVTSFEYQLHPVGPMVLGGLVIHPLAKAKEVAQLYREFTSNAPDEITVHLVFLTLPDGQQVAAFVPCYSGPLEKGEEVIRPLHEYGSPIMDTLGPMPYTEVQAQGGPLYPPGRLSYWKSSFLTDLSDDAIETFISRFAAVPSPFSIAAIEHLEGAISRVGNDETAYGGRNARYSLVITSEWIDPAETEKNIQWARELWEAMKPFESGGVHINYLGTEGEDRVKAAYGPAKYEWLVALKNKYDPTNFFHLNQNIKPTA